MSSTARGCGVKYRARSSNSSYVGSCSPIQTKLSGLVRARRIASAGPETVCRSPSVYSAQSTITVPLSLRSASLAYCCYQDAGQCSALQGGGEGPRGRAVRPERALDRAVLLLDVLAEDGQRGAADGAGEV